VFPAEVIVSTSILFLNTGEKENNEAFALMRSIRKKGISSELYPEPAKVDKQFKYAEKKNIPFVVTMSEEGARVKDIRSGNLQVVPLNELEGFFVSFFGKK
jgi:histidyl-tRNA synthetase